MKTYKNLISAIRSFDAALGQNKGVHYQENNYGQDCAVAQYGDYKVEFLPVKGKKSEVEIRVTCDDSWLTDSEINEILNIVE